VFLFLSFSKSQRQLHHKGGAGIKKREKEQGRRDETTQKTIKKKPMTTSQEFVGFFIVFLVVPVFPSLRRLCLGLSVYFLSNIIDNKRSETRDGRRGKTGASLFIVVPFPVATLSLPFRPGQDNVKKWPPEGA
jgi:hypothetical protein